MDYIEAVKNILGSSKDCTTTVMDLSNLLISKIMHIKIKDVSEISTLINQQISFYENEATYPLPIVIQALLNYKKSNYQLSINAVTEVLDTPKFEISVDLRAVCYTTIAINHRSLGERDTAFSYFQKALEIYTEDISEPYMNYLYGLNLYHVAEIYGELKEYHEMLNKQELFYKIAKSQGNIDFENRALNGIGRAYIGLELFDVALSYFQSANENTKRSANIPFIAKNLHDLGDIFNLLGDVKQSLLNYEKAFNIRVKNGYKNAAITTQIAISKVLIKQNRLEEAIDILEAAKMTAESINVRRKLGEILNSFSIVYEKKQDFEKALSYHKAFHQLKVELDNVDKTLLETQKVREANTQLKQQKAVIELQKRKIETTLEKLKVTNTYLENFAAVAAHDLKAPIRIASSFAKIIEKKYNDKWDKSDAEYFAYITTNIGKLGQMIDDLLALSKLDQDLLPAQKVRIPKVLNDVERRLYEKIKTSDTNLIYAQNIPILMAHPSLITQLFQNLIDNAIKYRGEDNPIITINTKVKDGYCEFEIKDNGQGIAMNEQRYIFELFAGTHRKDSSGIGLATCKKIVTHYGGNIWIESALNMGTSIFFTLPIA